MSVSWWHPDQFGERRGNLATRAKILRSVRTFFESQGFTEVETPVLQVSPGLDRHVRPLNTALTGAFDTRRQSLFLHTSPEFAMKKLLAAGEQKIFQVCHVFRDGETSKTHHPEFTLLEWYRAEKTYEALMNDIEQLILSVASDLTVSELKYNGRTFTPGEPWDRLTVSDAYEKFASIDILATVDCDKNPSSDLLRQAVRDTGMRCDQSASWDDLFHHVLLEKVEPELSKKPSVFLKEYPALLGALARTKPTDARVCERVEAYVCGLELANGFSELTDPTEQRERFERDRSLYRELYGEPPPIDDDFLAALSHMPPSAGMALGLDRLVMLITGSDDIRDVLWAPVESDSSSSK